MKCLGVCLLVLSLAVAVSAQTSTDLNCGVDLRAAHQVRIRWKQYGGAAQVNSYFIQYTSNAANSLTTTTADQWHNSHDPSSGQFEVIIDQSSNTIPITQAIVTGLQASTAYTFRIGVQFTSNSVVSYLSGTSASATTLAEGSSPAFSSLYVSGGCGNGYQDANATPDGEGVVTYTCTVAASVHEVEFEVIPAHFFSAVDLLVPFEGFTYTDSSPPSDITPLYPVHNQLSNVSVSVPITATSISSSRYTYSAAYFLNNPGQHTAFVFSIVSENDTPRAYVVNITRQVESETLQLNGPSTTQATALTAPVTPLELRFQALVWSETTIPSAASWSAWSLDQTVIGPSSFSFTFDNPSDFSAAKLSISPLKTQSASDICIDTWVSVTESNGKSKTHHICVAVVADQCSSNPAGIVTTWPSYLKSTTFYFPPPPYDGFDDGTTTTTTTTTTTSTTTTPPTTTTSTTTAAPTTTTTEAPTTTTEESTTTTEESTTTTTEESTTTEAPTTTTEESTTTTEEPTTTTTIL